MQLTLNPVKPNVEATRKFLSSKDKKMLLNNEWVDAQKGGVIETHDPASGSLLAIIPQGTQADVDAAVASAKTTFEQGTWRNMLPAERAKILWRIGELIDANIDELAELETLDQGKPLGVARWAEIPGAAEQFRYFAGMCSKLESKVIPSSIGYQPPGKRVHSYTLSEPVGVVAAITPWNSPLILTAMKLAPALCVGCSVVLKPAEDTSLTALRLGELCIEAGLPAGALNIVTGYGQVVGQALAEHNDVAKISFTGSTQTGRKILDAAKGNLKRVTLELGGKSPMIVLDDADLELAIPGVANAAFFNGGQVCVAGTRLYVQEGIADKLYAGIAEYAKGLTLGHGLDPATQMGPLVNPLQAAKVYDYIQSGLADGAKLLTGGGLGGPHSTFVEPTILTQCHNNMKVVREEVFGPVLSSMTFKTSDEALALANDTDYGLAASVWTQSLSHAHRFASDIEAGTVWINSHLMFDPSLPIGGYKQSGWGRESGMDAVLNYVETKTVCAVL
ncbi:aldehyde dehydrogenase family protein [Paraglaciecola sp. 2405UD69-4]|uniref:aldehyde dehydrogenase family protein n=1 Tax=Paraglaciecola sp. 2405UD69-4 TaxID=3391836 RepID=UPI0039C945CF